MNWDDLKYFLNVARSGNLTKAAMVLKVSQSTVSRRITELENSLGTRLFERYQTGYFLTDEGQRILRCAVSAEEQIWAVEREAAGINEQVSGTVRLATSDNLATDLIIPSLYILTARHPDLHLDITANTVTVPLGHREADLALRVVRPASGNLKLRQLGQMSYAVYASRRYLEKHPQSGNNPFIGRAIITWDELNSHLPAARWMAENATQATRVLQTSSLPMQISAVVAGLGLAILPDFLATDSELVKVVPSDQLFSNGLWLVIHADLSASSRIRAVADFLAEIVAAHPTLKLRS
ncbi:LysR family transcriptional regulator [Kosakonia radicincitans]|uniref:LysR family transcriptional regulator n=1 Tax=Kosakonia radicincitans TaxID=283686 RepID=UPI00236750E2|nr:LysR family transcriptional regulator [Kosakonia radicincitans]MDD7998235.1 LysR family transcriptional regulator [Kosakonia radicincitans]